MLLEIYILHNIIIYWLTVTGRASRRYCWNRIIFIIILWYFFII